MSVRPSVRHMPVLCQTAKHILKRFSSSGSDTILYTFSIPNVMAIFRRRPLTGAPNAGYEEVRKHGNFRQTSRFISGMIQDKKDHMERQQELVYGLLNDAIFNDLERPLPPVSRSRHSLTLNISETVRDTVLLQWNIFNYAWNYRPPAYNYTNRDLCPTEGCRFE